MGEIPSLMTQGTLWRTRLLYDLLSDYEIMRFQLYLLLSGISCHSIVKRKISRFLVSPYLSLQKDEYRGPMGKISDAWIYLKKHFFDQQIQDNVKSTKNSTFVQDKH